MKRASTSKAAAKRAYEEWVRLHPSPECRALRQHAIVEHLCVIPGRPRFLLAVRRCARECGVGEKRILDRRTKEVLATFDRTHGDDYLLPPDASPHVAGRVPRAHFQELLIEDDFPMPTEWLESMDSALERKKKRTR